MKILAYATETNTGDNLSALLAEIAALPLDDRIKDTPTTRLRLEAAARSRNNVWRMDFVKFRSAGPGKVSESRPTEDFSLNRDEYFGEETAMLYDASSGYAAMQYNHYGPRMSAIQNYLTIFAGQSNIVAFNDVTLLPMLRQDQRDRLNRMRVIKSYHYKVHVPAMRVSNGAARQSLGAILDDAIVAGSETLSVTVVAKKAHPLSMASVRAQIARLLGEPTLVESLIVGGKESEDGPTDHINMIQAQLVT
jgi:hypothetical protein